MATMKEIAQLSGVSRGTVDRVINNRGGVDQGTCAKVLRAAEQLNYSPNKIARSLAARKRNYLFTFILFSPIKAPFFAQIHDGILQEAEELRESGVTVKIRVAETWEAQAFIEQLDGAVADGSAGIAIAGINEPALVERIRQIIASGIPVITVNSEIPNCSQLAYVGSNAFQAGWTAAELIRLIQRDEKIVLGVILGFRSSKCHTGRFEGLKAGLNSMGIQWELVFVECNNDDDFDSFDIVRQQLRLHPEINTLFLATGSGAYGACRAVESSGMAKKLRVVCYDNTPLLAEMLKKQVISATVCQEPERQGAEPLRILFDYLALGMNPERNVVYTDNEIMIRECL